MGRLAMQAVTQLAPSYMYMYMYAWNKTMRWHRCNPITCILVQPGTMLACPQATPTFSMLHAETGTITRPQQSTYPVSTLHNLQDVLLCAWNHGFSLCPRPKLGRHELLLPSCTLNKLQLSYILIRFHRASHFSQSSSGQAPQRYYAKNNIFILAIFTSSYQATYCARV